VGQPIHFKGDVQDREHVRRVSTTIMEKIEDLARQSEDRQLGWRGVLSTG
jgi:hypothetical protein